MSNNSLYVSTTGGTGFFYTSLESNFFWLVTNRHNLYPLSPEEQETSVFPYSDRMRGWCDIIFSNKSQYLIENDINNRLLHHTNPKVDVIAINVSELFIKSMEPEKLIKYKYYKSYKNFNVFNKNNLPTDSPKIGDKVIVIGFPQKIPNKPPKMPEKSEAIIVSNPTEDYNYQTYFLINKKFYQGISGSPVFLKRTFNLNDPSSLTLLGIYAGNDKNTPNGVVFPSKLISKFID